MSIIQALADLDVAVTEEHLGREVIIDGKSVVCVKRGLTVEEEQQYSAGMGMSVEGLRITVDQRLLVSKPVRRSDMTVDGLVYMVSGLRLSGNRMRLTLTRNIG